MSNTRKATSKAKPSLFEQARQAKPRTEHYGIPLVDRDEGNRLYDALEEARAARARAETFGSEEDKKAAAKVYDAARAAVDKAYRRVTFRGLPPKDLDALTNTHADPPEGEDAPEGHVPFIYHLAVASCVGDGEDVTAEQWKELCEDVWPSAEGSEFRRAVLAANSKSYGEGIPFG